MVYYKIPIADGIFDYPAGCLLCCAYPQDGYMFCKFETCPQVGSDWVKITEIAFNAGCPDFSADVPVNGTAIVHVSADKSLEIADTGKFLSVDAAAVITVPADIFPVGVELEVFCNTSGVVTITAAEGVSFSVPGSTELVTESQTISDQYASIVLKQINTNVWSIQGAI